MLNPSTEVLETLKDAGISMGEFARMVSMAAPLTHGLGNRRFHHWIFMVKGSQVLKMNPWIKECTRQGSIDMVAHEDCEHCEGVGCPHCDYVGQIRVQYQQRSVTHGNGKSKEKFRNR